MRLDFNFETNIPDTVSDKATVQVDRISFEHPDGRCVDVFLDGDGDYGVKDNQYSGRWKGLQFIITTYDEHENVLHELSVSDDEITDIECEKLIEILKGSKPFEIEFYWEDDREHWGIPKGEPTCKNAKIELQYDDSKIEWSCEEIEAAA